MKLLVASSRRRCAAEIMAEACMAVALMAFVWILMTYSLYLGDNQIRTEMAARYAAWSQGNNNGTLPSASTIDTYFFFQSGLSKVSNITPALIPDVISGSMPSSATTYSSGDGSTAGGPFKVQVTYGVTDPSDASNPFPFNMLTTQLPLMTNSMMSVYSVSSTAQWDGDSDTWNTWGEAIKGLWSTLSGNAGAAGSIFSGLF